MSELVVDGLEVIDVKHEDGERPLLAAGPFELRREAFVIETPVLELRQFVASGHVPLFLISLARLLRLLRQSTLGAVESEHNEEAHKAKECDIRGQNEERSGSWKDESTDGSDGADDRKRESPAQQPERAQCGP